MQSLKLSSGFSLVNKNIIRNAAINASAVNTEETQNYKSWREIPGPKSYPIIGPLLSFLPGGALHNCKGIKLYDHMYKNFGPIVRLDGILGSPSMVLIFDADAVEQVLRSENTMPIRPGFSSLEYYRKRHNKTYDPRRPTGLISELIYKVFMLICVNFGIVLGTLTETLPHGENWKDFRSKVNQIMLQPKTIKLYSNVLAEVAEDMVARVRSIRDENNQIKNKFDVEMNLWALESIGVLALGTRLNCFDPNLPEDSEARKLIQTVHEIFAVLEKVDFGPDPWRYIATPNFKRAMKIYEEQDRITNFFIKNAMVNMKESKLKNDTNTIDSEKAILEKLLEIDVEVAHIMASDMLMAGVDTAANTAMATFYLLAKNVDKQSKLREEVISKKGRSRYLRACIKESMRMLPVVNGNLRQATKEYNLLGYKIPKDSMLIFSHQYMSNMKEYYPKPDEFIPERWIAEKDDPLYHGNAHPFANSPFGYGVRMCIGRRIAELEMETFISKMVENFQIDWEDGPINIKPIALNYVTEPFNFIFKDL